MVLKFVREQSMSIESILNALCKLSTIHSIAALSKFLRLPLVINEYKIIKGKIDINEFREYTNHELMSFYMPISGNLLGSAFLIHSSDSAKKLCDLICQRDQHTTCFNEDDKSALSEVTNILVGNFLSCFSQTLQLNILIHHVAIFDRGEFGEILSRSLKIKRNKRKSIIFYMNYAYQDIKSSLFLSFDERQLNLALNEVSIGGYKEAI